ncbi:MAG TPA: DNA modification methylase [Candidatus Paceibacterota bacterium]|nr:DNA modification methylase [Candidatus Paceibacterota bacterium]HMO82974.1 DNA modification methylase [Candidatus Paceibacterota bacterium]
MESLYWTTEQRKINDLIPQEVNPRKITDKQMSDLKRSLKEYNVVEIPAIDCNGNILAGHQRVKALQLLGRGEELIDVRVPNRPLTEDESRRYMLASNALGGDWDLEALKSFDYDLLVNIGFDSELLDDVWDTTINVELTQKADEEILAEIKTPTTQIGDVIELGMHRLVCGDSNDPEVLSRLLGTDKASMIMSDPIYNIDLDYNKGLGGKQNYGGTVNDTRSDDEYIDFLRQNIRTAIKFVQSDAHIFYWNTEQHIWILQTLYRELGIQNKRVCLWIKNGHNPTPRVAFNKCYEPCIYGTIGKPYLSEHNEYTEIMNVDIGSGNEGFDDINIWTAKRLAGSEYKHATAKPPTVYEKAIRRCTKVGDIILDSFGGSGSVLVASEQLKRRAFLAELEPVFCDLICLKFEMLTGKKRKLIGNYEKV